MRATLGTLSWEGCRVLRAFLGFPGSRVPRVRLLPKGARCTDNGPKGARRAGIPSLDPSTVGLTGAGSIIASEPFFMSQKFPGLGPIWPKGTKISDLPFFGPA